MSDPAAPDGAPVASAEPSGATEPTVSTEPAGPSKLIITLVSIAIVLTVGAVVTGFILASNVANDVGPLAVPAAPTPGEDGRYCHDLMPELPEKLIDDDRRELLVAEPGVAAWGNPAIILRCGLSDPAELTCASPLTRFTAADGTAVEWLKIAEGSAVTFLAVDRPVRIGVTLPASADISAIQQLTEVIGRVLPAREVCDRGVITPTDNG